MRVKTTPPKLRDQKPKKTKDVTKEPKPRKTNDVTKAQKPRKMNDVTKEQKPRETNDVTKDQGDVVIAKPCRFELRQALHQGTTKFRPADGYILGHDDKYIVGISGRTISDPHRVIRKLSDEINEGIVVTKKDAVEWIQRVKQHEREWRPLD